MKYGCHVDLEPGMEPDGCVLDYDTPGDCIHAPALVAAGKGKEACPHWRPIQGPRVEAPSLTLEEWAGVHNALLADHSERDFEPECPSCTARRKVETYLEALAASPMESA